MRAGMHQDSLNGSLNFTSKNTLYRKWVMNGILYSYMHVDAVFILLYKHMYVMTSPFKCFWYVRF